MIIFGIGLICISSTIGFMAGLTSGPIVATLMPLLFALATAGGNIYVVYGQGQKDNPVPAGERRLRARFIGAQLLIFSLAFLPGLWFGVHVKFHSLIAWPTKNTKAVYTDVACTDPAMLSLLRQVDAMLAGDGVTETVRREKIKAIHDSRTQWKPEPENREASRSWRPASREQQHPARGVAIPSKTRRRFFK